MRPVPGIPCRLKGRVFRGAAHGKFIHVRLAEHYGLRLPELFHNGRVIGREERFQHPGAATGDLVPDADHVLDGDRDARQSVPVFFTTVNGPGLLQRLLAIETEEGADCCVVPFDLPYKAVCDFFSRKSTTVPCTDVVCVASISVSCNERSFRKNI